MNTYDSDDWFTTLYSEISSGATLEQIKQRYGGIQLYIPKSQEDKERNRMIRQKKKEGVSVSTLAVQFRLSSSRIYEILRNN